MIFGLELITLEKGKNAGIRPLFEQNRRLGGVLLLHITVDECVVNLLKSHNFTSKTPEERAIGRTQRDDFKRAITFNMRGERPKTPKQGTNWMPPIQGTPKGYDSEKASTFPLDQEHKKPLLRPWFYNLGFILFFLTQS